MFMALASVAIVAAAFVATASAMTIRGTAKAEVLRGTAGADRIYGGGGNDRLYGLAGGDYLFPGLGVDMVSCGAGIDHVLAEKKDKVAKDCEIVLRPDIEVRLRSRFRRRSPRWLADEPPCSPAPLAAAPGADRPLSRST